MFGEGEETEETKLGISKPNSEHSRDSTEFSNQNLRQICKGVYLSNRDYCFIYNDTMIVYLSDWFCFSLLYVKCMIENNLNPSSIAEKCAGELAVPFSEIGNQNLRSILLNLFKLFGLNDRTQPSPTLFLRLYLI